MTEFVLKRIYKGIAETEYIGDGQINRVRMIISRELVPGGEIEIYGGRTRYNTSYRGTLYIDGKGRLSFKKGRNVWLVNQNGSLKKTDVGTPAPFGL